MTQLDGKSKNIINENIEKLKEIFPEIFSEGKIDFSKLEEELGNFKEDENERYNFTWNGKSEAKRIALTPSTGTLRPCKDESKDWDTTGNLYIEGDNLEVLKLLQKSYHKKVKMIYIDPPYNTGKDFVYKDNFRDNIKNYMQITGQVDSDGNKLSTNSETSGRYHSDWLNMMYPRLKLARNLLKDHGVIFISIDDNEVANLRKLCDEIFGEDNFVGTIGWESKTKSQNTKDSFNKLQPKVESIFVYAKRPKMRFNLISKGQKEYSENDEKGEFRYALIEQMNSEDMRGRATMIFPIKGIEPEIGKQWKIGKDTVTEFEDRNDIVIRNNKPYRKMRPDDERSETTEPFWGFFSKELGTAESGKKELTNLIEKHGFETVKPIEIIYRLIFHTTEVNDIILDFFSGSATTAHAVMKLNSEDDGNRKFICVQLPETTDEKSESFKAGYKNICEIGKERIRRAGEKVKTESGKEDLDIGFKVLKLDSSNIKSWDSDFENLETNLLESVENIKSDRNENDLVYEILLKYGLDLTLPIEELNINNKKIQAIGFGSLVCCLDNDIDTDTVEKIAELKKRFTNDYGLESMRVVFKDSSFKDSVVKTNALAILKQNGIDEVVSV